MYSILRTTYYAPHTTYYYIPLSALLRALKDRVTRRPRRADLRRAAQPVQCIVKLYVYIYIYIYVYIHIYVYVLQYTVYGIFAT